MSLHTKIDFLPCKFTFELLCILYEILPNDFSFDLIISTILLNSLKSIEKKLSTVFEFFFKTTCFSKTLAPNAAE